MWIKSVLVVLTTLIDNISILSNASPGNSIKRYWIFALAASTPEALRFIWKFRMNKKNSYGSPLSNKSILNLYKSYCSYVESLRNLFFIQYFSDFVSLLISIKIIRGGSTWICTAPLRQLFLYKMFLILDCLFLPWLYMWLLCKLSYARSN